MLGSRVCLLGSYFGVIQTGIRFGVSMFRVTKLGFALAEN